MTNKEWHRCEDPLTMIEALRGIATGRKGQLYLCGGCRTIWSLLYSSCSREAIEVAERYADGNATEDELHYANWSAETPTFGHDFVPRIWKRWHTDGPVPSDVQRLVDMGVMTSRQLEEDEPEIDRQVQNRLLAIASLAEAATCCDPFRREPHHDWWHRYITLAPWPGDWLLRCVFGDPFLPFVFFSPGWLTPGIVELARTMYDGRDFDRMPALGEALKASGCRNQDVLDHCRSQKPHVRGCWVVDLVLGRS
jgi:hypothetical protein